MKYYNSIQDGACCKDCFKLRVDEATKAGTLVAVSQQFRTNAAMVTKAVADHIDGLPKDPFVEDEYIDRVIIEVSDGTDPKYLGTREIIIIEASLTKDECFSC